jgi:hypothetical protein
MKNLPPVSAFFRAALIALFLQSTSLLAWAQEWTKMSVTEVGDVAAGERNFILIVNRNGELLQSTDEGKTFEPFGRDGVARVALGPRRSVLIVDTDGKVWSLRGSRWAETDASGMADVAISPKGEVACTAGVDGAVWLSTDGARFTEDPGTKDYSRVSYDPLGTLWAVDTSGGLWKRARGTWEKTSAEKIMVDVAAGPQGAIWLTDKGGGVWVSNWGEHFFKTPGQGFQNIAVAPDGIAWIAGQNGTLWRCNANVTPKAPAPGPSAPAPVPPKPAPPPPPPPPPKPAPKPAPPVKQAIRYVNPEGQTKGVVFFKIGTVLPAVVIVEVGKRAPQGNAFKPGEVIARGQSPAGIAHKVVISGLNHGRVDYYYVVIAGELRQTGTFTTAANMDPN